METAVKVKFAMLLEHNKREGEFGYNEVVTRYFETPGDFFEAWGESMPSGTPTAVEGDLEYLVHKRFGTVYVDDEGKPVACVQVDECSVEEAMKAARR